MRSERAFTVRLLAVLATCAIAFAACGGGDDDDDSANSSEGSGEEGGTIVDYGTFVADPPAHIDPALNNMVDAYTVVNALYDGLTELDTTDPANVVVKPLVAESWEANADATEYVFKIKDGLVFSNDEAVLPSSFVRGWERATEPDFAGYYSYLFGSFIEGGQAKLDGEADTISGVTADDDAMTLTVKLTAPYSNFPTVAGFQTFMPMPEAVEELDDQTEWENGVMIGNGPFKMAEARTDELIVIERNDKWGGDIFGNTRALPDKIEFHISGDPESSYDALESGEGDTASIPSGRTAEAQENYGTTIDTPILGSYHYNFSAEDPAVAGPENKLLRQAISQAINDDEINDAVYDGTRTTSTGITPKGIPGWKADICDYCLYDQEAAQAAFDEWKSAGNEQAAPIKIQFPRDSGQDDLVQIVIDNLKAVGIEAEAEPMAGETYIEDLAGGACQFCMTGWFADYPTYDNFMFDLFASESQNNILAYSNPTFDDLVSQAKQTVDPAEQGTLFNQAEEVLLNEDVAAVPFNWYNGGYAYNQDKLKNFTQTPLGLILWEQVEVSE